ncbi:MAG: phBC6A51 family helix-turn-helix protein [Clostridia bacterium]
MDELNEKQLKCINLMITSNKTQKTIAKEIEVSQKTICEWKKKKEFKDELQKQIQNNFSLLAIDAQKELKKLLKSKNEYIRIQAVKDVLDRAGYKPAERIKNELDPSEKFADICKQLGGKGLSE